MKIAATIIKDNVEEALNESKEAKEKGADIIEFRIDYMKNLNLEKLLSSKNLPVIITNRVRGEGGKFAGNEEERISYLQKAIDLGADYIDIEVSYFLKEFNRKDTKLIVSYHDFNKTSEKLDEIYLQACNKSADIVKIATMANSPSDVKRMLRLIDKADRPMIGICMGEIGKETRIYQKNYLTFAVLSEERRSAPGQYTIDEIKQIGRIAK